MINKERLLNNFLRYAKISTQSVLDAGKIPSSPGQLELARIVAEDLKSAGVQDVALNEQGFLFGTLPQNFVSDKKVPVIAYVAHFDTCTDASGENVKPQLINNYNGQTIVYPGNKEITLSCSDDPELRNCIGHTIITSDGTTVLGSDDKSGIAEIVEMANYFKENPKERHGGIRIAIMPDEEVAAGAHALNINELKADVAYTIDSIGSGSVDVETFNGYRGKITFTGVNAFPGYGKGVYLSASRLMSEFISEMPTDMWPENCEGRQGIWWIDDLRGGVGMSEFQIFLRNFDLDGIKEQESILERIKEKIIKKYPKAKIDINISESYKNYKYELDKDKRVVEYAEEALRRINIKPRQISVRGGNDASHFCFKGLLATNLFAGFRLMHSLKEWVSLEVMEKATENLVMLSKVWMEKTTK